MYAKQTSESQKLHVYVKTWARDSHGLFDYESRSVTFKKLAVFCTSKIIRTETNVQLVPKETPLESHNSAIANIELKNGTFFLSKTSPDDFWIVTRHMKTGHILREGDVFKLGRVQMTVKSIVTEMKTDSEATDVSSEGDNECFEAKAAVCRICLCEANDIKNPLLSLCECAGSIKHIHLECLQTWIEFRKEINQGENSVCWFWKRMDCELCKTPYPFKCSVAGRTVDLINDKPVAPYMTLLSNQEVYIVSFMNDGAIKVGRGHDSEFRVSDISVSRYHARIRYVNGCFVLEDNNSKFGSLIKAKDVVTVESMKDLQLQVGRSVFSFSSMKKVVDR